MQLLHIKFGLWLFFCSYIDLFIYFICCQILADVVKEIFAIANVCRQDYSAKYIKKYWKKSMYVKIKNKSMHIDIIWIWTCFIFYIFILFIFLCHILSIFSNDVAQWIYRYSSKEMYSSKLMLKKNLLKNSRESVKTKNKILQMKTKHYFRMRIFKKLSEELFKKLSEYFLHLDT